MAGHVLKMAQEAAKVEIEVAAIGEGMGSLLPILDAIGQQLGLVQQARFEQMVQRQVAPTPRKRSKR